MEYFYTKNGRLKFHSKHKRKSDAVRLVKSLRKKYKYVRRVKKNIKGKTRHVIYCKR